MLRGEFHTGSGLVIPNNITKFGAATILAAAMRGETPAFWVGLVDGVPENDLQLEVLSEPAIGTGGYARIEIPADEDGWPTMAELNGEPYIESDWLIWEATGDGFTVPIRRMVIVPTENELEGDVFAISAPLPSLRQITPGTPEADRKFKYRVYLR